MDRSCLSDDEVAAYLGDELAEASRGSVVAHLAACDRCRRIVSALAAVDELENQLAPGQRLGRFELRRRIGEGAMGEVWSALDPDLARDVALKVLHGATVRSAERLRREAQAMARLNHPNVVTIHELGASSGRVFCAMELVEGMTLRAWLGASRQWRDVLRVLLDAGRGIAAAHGVGLVHRDIKPENILIANDGRTLVTDFGLATLAARAHPTSAPAIDIRSIAVTVDEPREPCEATELTASGMLIGTPAYMAPEQLGGARVDAAADQFSFCVTAYEALLGVRPFAGRTVGELADAIRDARFEAATRRGPPAGAVDCLVRGLAAEAEDRWPSVAALLDALDRAAAAPRRRRRVAAVVAGAVAMTAVFAFASGRSDDASRSTIERAAAERIDRAWQPQRAAALRAAFEATGHTLASERAAAAITALDGYRARWLAARVDAWSATHERREQTLEVLELRVACLERLAELLGGIAESFRRPEAADIARAPLVVHSLEPVETCANLPRLRARSPAPSTPEGRAAERGLRELELLQLRGRHREVRAKADALLEEAKATGEPMAAARARFAIGSAQANSGALADAEATLRSAVLDAAAARDHYLVAEIWLRLHTLVGLELARPAEAQQIEAAARAAIAQAGDDPRQRAELSLTLGIVEYRRGNVRAARDRLREARDGYATARGPEHPTVANAQVMLGGMRIELDEKEEGRRDILEAIESIKRSLGERHPTVAMGYQSLMSLAAGSKDWATAETYGRLAVAINAAVRGEDHPDTAKVRMWLARPLIRQNKLDEARTELELARATYAKALPAEHPDHLVVELGFVQLADRAGDRAGAGRLGAALLARTWSLDVSKGRRAFVLSEVARITATDDPRGALALYDEALALYAATEAKDRAAEIELLEELARTALAAGQPAIALRWFDAMPAAAATLSGLRAELERARGLGQLR